MKTIDEVKQEVAEEYGYKSNSVYSTYEQIVINPHYISYDKLINIYDEVAIRYASQFEDRIKELEDELGLAYNALELIYSQTILTNTNI